jgi:hypothetical protein
LKRRRNPGTVGRFRAHKAAVKREIEGDSPRLFAFGRPPSVRAVRVVVKIGQGLLAVKVALLHGQFLPWLRAEFGWVGRTAYNFISDAERFKVAFFATLPIVPPPPTCSPPRRSRRGSPSRHREGQGGRADHGGGGEERWDPDELSELVRQLREFVEALEKPERGGKTKGRGQ